MPVITIKEHTCIDSELRSRFSQLMTEFEDRPLKSATEGCRRRARWTKPEEMVATHGTAAALQLAVDDFKNILAQVRRLKAVR